MHLPTIACRALGIFLPVLLGMTVAPANAQDYAAKPLRIIVPYPPGGLGDIFPRALGAGLAEQLGQPIIIDNRPGASQIIGAHLAAELFKSLTGVDIVHIPYKGAAPAMTDVMAGHVDMRSEIPKWHKVIQDAKIVIE